MERGSLFDDVMLRLATCYHCGLQPRLPGKAWCAGCRAVCVYEPPKRTPGSPAKPRNWRPVGGW
jgi:hypothetical protein